MVNESRMEQHYAVSSKTGVLTHINVAHELDESLSCPHCGCKMLKRCGNIRRWHFAHDYRSATTDLQKNCSYETYLHGYAKYRFKEWFEKATSINLFYEKRHECKHFKHCIWKKYAENGCKNVEYKCWNLKKSLNLCLVEHEVEINGERFRPDLLWLNKDKPDQRIFIEIKVTHECTEKKINSKARIIEFEVHSEEDVDALVGHDIKEGDNVRFYGISSTESANEIQIPPQVELSKFIMYKTGKAYTEKQCDCLSYLERKHSSIFEMSVLAHNMQIGEFHTYGLLEAKARGLEVKNCYLCKHNLYTGCPMCGISSTAIHNGADALECDYFDFDQYDCEMIALDFTEYKQSNDVDTWMR